MTAQVIDFKTRKVLNAEDPADTTIEQRVAHIDSYLQVVRDHLVGIEMDYPAEYMTHRPILVVPNSNGKTSIVMEPCGMDSDVFVASMKYAFSKYNINAPITVCDEPGHLPPDDIA